MYTYYFLVKDGLSFITKASINFDDVVELYIHEESAIAQYSKDNM